MRAENDCGGAAPYLVKYSPSVPSCNSLYEASWFMATAVLDPQHRISLVLQIEPGLSLSELETVRM